MGSENFVDHQIFFLTKFCLLFFNSSKPVLTEKNFVDWPIRDLFSPQKVNIKKLTADISLKSYLVTRETLVVRIPWMSYLSNLCMNYSTTLHDQSISYKLNSYQTWYNFSGKFVFIFKYVVPNSKSGFISKKWQDCYLKYTFWVQFLFVYLFS